MLPKWLHLLFGVEVFFSISECRRLIFRVVTEVLMPADWYTKKRGFLGSPSGLLHPRVNFNYTWPSYLVTHDPGLWVLGALSDASISDSTFSVQTKPLYTSLFLCQSCSHSLTVFSGKRILAHFRWHFPLKTLILQCGAQFHCWMVSLNEPKCARLQWETHFHKGQ